jgi:hypothetical protein
MRRFLSKLRRPSYAAAVLAGFAYFALILGPMLFGSDRSVAPEFAAIVLAFAPFLLAVLTAWWWLWGGYEGALGLTPAEAQILVPAPIARQDLLRYRIMKAQVSIVGAAVFFGLLFPASHIPLPLRILSVWTVLSVVHLHQAASSLIHASAGQQGIAGWKRNRVALVVFGLALSAFLWLLISAGLELRSAASLEALQAAFREIAARPVAILIFLPFRLVLDPLSAPDVSAWLAAWPAAFLILVLHYVWVIRTDAAFEEGAVDAGRRRAERVAAIRKGRVSAVGSRRVRGDRPAFFPLSPTGRPAVAILWKNMVGIARRAQATSIVGLSVILSGFFVFLAIILESAAKAADAFGLILLSTGGLLTILGPTFVRNDLREDRSMIDILRSYPVSGQAMVAVQVGSSAISLTLIQLGMLSAGAVLLLFGEVLFGFWRWMFLGLLASTLLLPAVNGLTMASQNAALLFFPDWVPEHVQGSGIEGLGQQMITMLAAVTSAVVGLFVPVFAAGTILLRTGLDVAPAIFASCAGLGILWGEVILVVVLLGDAFADLDPPEARR